MSVSKVVKSKQCYLHPKTSTDNMHTCLNFILEKEHSMGAISSEIVHLLKVKLSLQNDQRWLLLLSWFSKFSGGGPSYPPPKLQKNAIYIQYVIYFVN